MNFPEAVREAIDILDEEASGLAKLIDSTILEARPDLLDSRLRLDRLETTIAALKAEPTDEHPYVRGPADVDLLLRNRIAYQDREHFVVVLLNTKNRVLDSPTVAIGTNGRCMVHPREVFKPAIAASAASIIVAHNHPTGDTAPSPEDRDVTRRLKEAADLVGIELLDHLILGRDFRSLKEAGYL